MTSIKKSPNNKSWQGCGEKGTLLHCWWECKPVQPLWRTVWRFLKLKIKLPYDPGILLLGIYLEKNTNLRRYTHPSVHRSTHYLQQPKMKATQMPSNRQADKDVGCIQNAIYLLFIMF